MSSLARPRPAPTQTLTSLFFYLSCAKDRGRTGDPSLFRGMLYQLSYLGFRDILPHLQTYKINQLVTSQNLVVLLATPPRAGALRPCVWVPTQTHYLGNRLFTTKTVYKVAYGVATIVYSTFSTVVKLHYFIKIRLNKVKGSNK